MNYMDEIFQQYKDLKAKHPDAILLFRTGDFYVTYNDDAETASKVLGISVTKTADKAMRVACFPYHALDAYLPKLIAAKLRVAICDQIDCPKMKKLVKRGSQELTK